MSSDVLLGSCVVLEMFCLIIYCLVIVWYSDELPWFSNVTFSDGYVMRGVVGVMYREVL